MNVNTDGLPPEMQQRIAEIIEKAKMSAPAPQPQQAPAPPVRQQQPSLMEHTVALRQEVHALRQEVAAMAQVTEAVGQAVGQIYNAFFQQSQAPTYSSAFQAQGDEQVTQDDF
jgi:hypothetical protein